MLKAYFERQCDTAALSEDLNPEPLLSKVSPVMLSSLVGTAEDDITDPSRSVPVGRLENSAVLAKLPEFLSYLTPTESKDVQRLICDFRGIFGDVPSQTNVLEHDIGLTRPNEHIYNEK